MKAFKNLINGQWVDASNGATFENRNPAKNDEVIGTFPSATREDTRRAIAAAREALPKWAGMPAPSRGAILDKASQIIASRMDEMAAVLTREEGRRWPKPRARRSVRVTCSATLAARAGASRAT